MLQTCPKCRGVKKCRHIGWVMKDCDRCDGTGKIKELVCSESPVSEVTDEAIKEAVAKVIKEKKTRSKDGREQEENAKAKES